MAFEATLIFETTKPIPMTCSDTVGIEKGTLLALSDPFTVAAHASANQQIGGIAAGEKIASDGITTIDVFREGIFKVTCSGSVAVGDSLALSSVANKIMSSSATCSGSKTCGLALETVTGDETFLMELRPGSN